jgi:hypothetical protein
VSVRTRSTEELMRLVAEEGPIDRTDLLDRIAPFVPPAQAWRSQKRALEIDRARREAQGKKVIEAARSDGQTDAAEWVRTGQRKVAYWSYWKLLRAGTITYDPASGLVGLGRCPTCHQPLQGAL